MNSLVPFKWISFFVMGIATTAFGQVTVVEVHSEPFEPMGVPFFNPVDKFAHPRENIAPDFLYPFELRRSAIQGEAVILVTVGADGLPLRLSALSGTHAAFIKAAIDSLKNAKWDLKRLAGESQLTCFYYRAVYKIE